MGGVRCASLHSFSATRHLIAHTLPDDDAGAARDTGLHVAAPSRKAVTRRPKSQAPASGKRNRANATEPTMGSSSAPPPAQTTTEVRATALARIAPMQKQNTHPVGLLLQRRLDARAQRSWHRPRRKRSLHRSMPRRAESLRRPKGRRTARSPHASATSSMISFELATFIATPPALDHYKLLSCGTRDHGISCRLFWREPRERRGRLSPPFTTCVGA